MGVGIPLSKGTWVESQNPNDAKYFNDTQPWTSVAEVLAGIPIGERHIGLPVNIDKVEYCFKEGIEDSHLILKQKHVSELLLIPITNLNETEVTLDITNYDNVFRINTFSDKKGLHINIPLDTSNFMCFIHIVHKGTYSKQVTFINPLFSNFSNNTLNLNSPVFDISANNSKNSYSYIALAMYVHKIGSKWNLDYKYTVELTRTF